MRAGKLKQMVYNQKCDWKLLVEMHCIATVFEGPEQTEACDMIGRGTAINLSINMKTDSATGP